MTKITVSYRRSDSDAITGRIFDRLIAHYGAGSVFRDMTTFLQALIIESTSVARLRTQIFYWLLWVLNGLGANQMEAFE